VTAPIQWLSLLVPCYNEEGNIARFKTELISPFLNGPFKVEFIFVDDGSQDQTFSKLKELQASFPHVKIVRHQSNQGLGAALRTGINASEGDALVTLDSDLTFHPSQIPTLLGAYTDKTDCVMGSALQGRFESVSWPRVLLSRGVNLCYRLLLNKSFTATSSLFRLYRTESLKQMPLRCTGFDINAEILIKMIFSGFSIVEVPVTLSQRIWGKSKIHILGEVTNHMKMFVKIFWWRGKFKSKRR